MIDPYDPNADLARRGDDGKPRHEYVCVSKIMPEDEEYRRRYKLIKAKYGKVEYLQFYGRAHVMVTPRGEPTLTFTPQDIKTMDLTGVPIFVEHRFSPTRKFPSQQQLEDKRKPPFPLPERSLPIGRVIVSDSTIDDDAVWIKGQLNLDGISAPLEEKIREKLRKREFGNLSLHYGWKETRELLYSAIGPPRNGAVEFIRPTTGACVRISEVSLVSRADHYGCDVYSIAAGSDDSADITLNQFRGVLEAEERCDVTHQTNKPPGADNTINNATQKQTTDTTIPQASLGVKPTKLSTSSRTTSTTPMEVQSQATGTVASATQPETPSETTTATQIIPATATPSTHHEVRPVPIVDINAIPVQHATLIPTTTTTTATTTPVPQPTPSTQQQLQPQAQVQQMQQSHAPVSITQQQQQQTQLPQPNNTQQQTAGHQDTIQDLLAANKQLMALFIAQMQNNQTHPPQTQTPATTPVHASAPAHAMQIPNGNGYANDAQMMAEPPTKKPANTSQGGQSHAARFQMLIDNGIPVKQASEILDGPESEVANFLQTLAGMRGMSSQQSVQNTPQLPHHHQQQQMQPARWTHLANPYQQPQQLPTQQQHLPTPTELTAVPGAEIVPFVSALAKISGEFPESLFTTSPALNYLQEIIKNSA